ncbi:uncharacterized protein LOC119678539 [Teleopsis dalmanni]|uniref:uncharacterized protein LOC119678539 n=1 Tax=Teleopsis dalmanni TaxID=139649 RepID=UPI000D32B34B|nr:uncharacterized protein LOC119678539 [Teleopsis dalmanni]
MNNRDKDKIDEIFKACEKAADDVLTQKGQIIALSKKEEDVRVAIREITKSTDKKVWITIGSMLVKIQREKALELLKKDKQEIQKNISILRSEQKVSVNELRDYEFLKEYPGSNIRPMDSRTMSTLKNQLHL